MQQPPPRPPIKIGSALEEGMGTTHSEVMAWHRRMQEREPVRYVPEKGTWQVFLYEDVQRVLSDYKHFSFEVPIAGLLSDSLTTINSDPPRHRRYRGLVAKIFTPHMLDQRAGRIRALVNEILTGCRAGGRMDFVEQLSRPLPVRIFSEVLGLPVEDLARLQRWSTRLRSLTPDLRDPEVREYFSRVILARMQEPHDDLISMLVRTEMEGGKRLTHEEALQMVSGLLVAGNTNPHMLLSLAMRRLVEQPEIFQDLRQDPSLIPGFLEEVLRYEFVASRNTRLARCDFTLRGCEIREGQFVTAWTSAANFDESVFPQAQRFDMRRSPNPHLSFGHGIHTCLGAPLVRLQSRIVFEQIIAQWSEVHGDPEHPPVYGHQQVGILASFPVCFTLV